MLDLHRLRLLRELKHRGTLAAVADALAYTLSAISQQLSVLEAEAGAPLLERAVNVTTVPTGRDTWSSARGSACAAVASTGLVKAAPSAGCPVACRICDW